ncbi:MAG TPA: hypothetical protein VFG45_02425 [Candidatus Nitrosocosmicus sp.]|nr:hypothetical protein [Candidatus Nitrosocosmicus sp.]
MNKNLIIVYILCGILAVTGIVYFLVAYGEYEDWVELLSFGIQDETTEKQVEISLFVISGLIYFGIVIWLVKTRFIKKSPYIAAILVSVALILTYITSRTVGVPIVGVEYYVGKLDMISKILQVVVIALSVVGLYKIHKSLHTLQA